ncbi:phosphatase PAP2 family protein [Phenylobacterium sp.]|uniref:phosphatase PAP2 family protein n=1 Tax=Phenylobacterium sp. TaxID=1871053 RepID=UPI001226A964|nr:phosphatase PAP2 family protein [Phenylobacterium sp.]THD60977.1 MAG: phosphatase PAP2 family protein [Phenylobacterium sp.]
MRKTVAGLLLALTAAGAATAPSAAAPAKPPKPTVSKFLAPGELDPAQVLPAPPRDGSPEALAELAELHRLEAARTPERFALAKHDEDFEDVTSIAAPLGPAFDLARLPATALLFEDLRNEDSLAVKRFKAFFARTRPITADPTLNPCKHGEDGKTAYPSGHATMGYSAAAVLSNLMPGNAQVIQARAADYAESRLICEAHYRRDVEGGHVLAVALVAELMTKPKFREELEAARAELTAAHIAP